MKQVAEERVFFVEKRGNIVLLYILITFTPRAVCTLSSNINNDKKKEMMTVWDQLIFFSFFIIFTAIPAAIGPSRGVSTAPAWDATQICPRWIDENDKWVFHLLSNIIINLASTVVSLDETNYLLPGITCLSLQSVS